MSFNNIHINRSNYEEYFLLYVDNELGAEERSAVEAFASANPDLQEELDILLSTTLDIEHIILNDKDFLLSEEMKYNIVDESLLLYIDNELNEDEKVNVEAELITNPDLQLQFDLLQQTKLDNNEVITYPYKKVLYRHSEERSVRPMFFLRIAVAVIIILAASILVWMSNNNNQVAPDIAQTPAKQIQEQIKSSESPIIIEPQDNFTALSEISSEEDQPKENNKIDSKQAFVPAKPVVKKETEENQIALHDVAVELPVENTSFTAEKVSSVNTPQQIINNPTVTTPASVAYINTDATASNSWISNAVVLEDDDKKGSVRGFLRKASRFIERRTGINPVNEDDELLIGVVAIKL